MLTEREEHIKGIFLPEQRSLKKTYLEESKVEEIVKKISEIGENIGFIGNEVSMNPYKATKRKHKYDVWIAKEIKKDLTILDKPQDFILIADWAITTKANIFNYSFQDAFKEQKIWHTEKFKEHDIKDLMIPELDPQRVIYRCKDNFFFYLLTSSELNYEGKLMKNCVRGVGYKKKVDNTSSLIISLRDEDNRPHVTMEISVNNFNGKIEGRVIQQFGAANTTPKKKYRKKLVEFLLFSTGFKDIEDRELLEFLNLNYL